mmetsp:Transcript_26155/g.84436  ORF Transcript_26155/g.84436 Transcript_26155/m.84436 type:complete len:346 (+) Transcript_26155:332-1369(+)
MWTLGRCPALCRDAAREDRVLCQQRTSLGRIPALPGCSADLRPGVARPVPCDWVGLNRRLVPPVLVHVLCLPAGRFGLLSRARRGPCRVWRSGERPRRRSGLTGDGAGRAARRGQPGCRGRGWNRLGLHAQVRQGRGRSVGGWRSRIGRLQPCGGTAVSRPGPFPFPRGSHPAQPAGAVARPSLRRQCLSEQRDDLFGFRRHARPVPTARARPQQVLLLSLLVWARRQHVRRQPGRRHATDTLGPRARHVGRGGRPARPVRHSGPRRTPRRGACRLHHPRQVGVSSPYERAGRGHAQLVLQPAAANRRAFLCARRPRSVQPARTQASPATAPSSSGGRWLKACHS